MNKISVVISTYNSAKDIKACLDSVKWADEIVVVDDGSTDNTVEIAKHYTKHIFHHKSVGYVEPARNFAISKATGDWLLIVDADEVIPQTLAKKLQEIASEEQTFTHVLIPRKNIIFGKWMQHTGWWPDHQIRFFKRGTVTWKDEIHSIPNVKGSGITLEGENNAIVHVQYTTVTQFITKNYGIYAPQEARELLKKGYTFSYADAIRFPSREFLSRYFAREGYKDGFHGLVMSILMSIYHFILFLHLWEAKQFAPAERKDIEKSFRHEWSTIQKEFLYWITKMKIDSAKNPLTKFALKVKRKLH